MLSEHWPAGFSSRLPVNTNGNQDFLWAVNRDNKHFGSHKKDSGCWRDPFTAPDLEPWVELMCFNFFFSSFLLFRQEIQRTWPGFQMYNLSGREVSMAQPRRKRSMLQRWPGIGGQKEDPSKETHGHHVSKYSFPPFFLLTSFLFPLPPCLSSFHPLSFLPSCLFLKKTA